MRSDHVPHQGVASLQGERYKSLYAPLLPPAPCAEAPPSPAGTCSQVHKAKVWPRQPEGPCSPGFGGPASIGLEVSFPPPLPRLATLSPSHLQRLYSGTLPFCHFPRDFACSWAIWSLRGDFAGLRSAQRGTGGLVSPSHFFEDILATLVFTCQVGALLPSFNTPDKLVS